MSQLGFDMRDPLLKYLDRGQPPDRTTMGLPGPSAGQSASNAGPGPAGPSGPSAPPSPVTPVTPQMQQLQSQVAEPTPQGAEGGIVSTGGGGGIRPMPTLPEGVGEPYTGPDWTTGPINPTSMSPSMPPEGGTVPPPGGQPTTVAPEGPGPESTTNMLVAPPHPAPAPAAPAPTTGRRRNPTPEAPAAPAAPATPEAPAPAAPAPTDWSQGPWDEARVMSYFQSRGVTPNATSPGYWVQQWNDWGKNNPGFFFQRIQNADEFGGPGSGQPVGGNPGNITVNNPTDPRVMEAIMKILAQGSQPVSGDDPSIRAQFQPQDAVIQRNNARARAGAAERQFAQGQTGEGQIDTEVNKINQASNLDSAGLMGTLVGQELSARRSMVMNALQLAHGEEALQLQAQLAQIDANLRLLGLNNQNQQFYDNMGYNIGHDQAGYNQALLAYLAGQGG